MTVNYQKPVIGISLGDPNGIGPEVIIKSFLESKMYKYCTPVLYSCNTVIDFYCKMFSIQDLPIEIIRNPKQLKEGKLNLFCNWMGENTFIIEPGQSTSKGGWYALKSLQAAIYALKNKLIDALVTGPINKFNIQSEDFKFPGHSEYLMHEAGESDYLMLMMSDDLRVGLVTVHLPISEVPKQISHEKIAGKLRILNQTLIKDFGINRPTIAVLGLNPHAGENSLLGKEEAEIIEPVIKAANDMNIVVLGPYPADGFFGNQMYNKFDAILAMYHDQGLIPFKTLAFGSGVNYTAGLSFIRTSPGHGTAYNIAGQNAADESSFREAVFSALKILRNRAIYDESTKNPLQRKINLEKEE